MIISTLFGRRPDQHRPPVLRRPARRRARLRDRRAAPRPHRSRRPRSSSPALLLAGCGLRLAIRSRSRVVPCRGHPRRGAGDRRSWCPRCFPTPPRRQQAPRLPATADLLEVEPDLPRRRRPGVARHQAPLPRRPDRLRASPLGRRRRDPRLRFDTDIRSFPFATLGTAAGRVMIIGAAGGHEVLVLALLRRRPHRRHRAQPGHLRPRHRRLRRLLRPPRRPARGELRERRRALLPRAQRRRLRPRVVPGARQLRGGQRRERRARSCSRRATCTRATRSRRASSTSARTGSSPRSSVRSTTTTSRTAPPATSRPAREALGELGSTTRPPHHGRHLADDLRAATLSTILVKKHAVHRRPRSPASPPAARRGRGLELRHAPGHRRGNRWSTDRHPAATPSSTTSSTSYRYDVEPISDDGPFFWHFARSATWSATSTSRSTARPRRTRSASGCSCCCWPSPTLFAAVFLLLPFVAIRKTGRSCPARDRRRCTSRRSASASCSSRSR